MRKYIIVLVSLISLNVGCSKDANNPKEDSDAEYYFQFNVDGVQKQYEYGSNQVNLVGSQGYDENTKAYSIQLSGTKNIFESGRNTLSVFVGDSEGFLTGVDYSNIPGEGDAYPDFVFSMGYYDEDGILYIAGGAGENPMFGLYKSAFVTFSEITDTQISGTFSGTLIAYDSSSGRNEFLDSVVVSEGKFKVAKIGLR